MLVLESVAQYWTRFVKWTGFRRSIRQKQKKIDAAMSKIETEKGHVATDEEIAEELEITVDELNSWQGQTKMPLT